MEPRYFTFSGNIIQFQSLVIRFDDEFVRKGDPLRGRSAYIFWKVFLLDGKNTQEFEITKFNSMILFQCKRSSRTFTLNIFNGLLNIEKLLLAFSI